MFGSASRESCQTVARSVQVSALLTSHSIFGSSHVFVDVACPVSRTVPGPIGFHNLPFWNPLFAWLWLASFAKSWPKACHPCKVTRHEQCTMHTWSWAHINPYNSYKNTEKNTSRIWIWTNYKAKPPGGWSTRWSLLQSSEVCQHQWTWSNVACLVKLMAKVEQEYQELLAAAKTAEGSSAGTLSWQHPCLLRAPACSKGNVHLNVDMRDSPATWLHPIPFHLGLQKMFIFHKSSELQRCWSSRLGLDDHAASIQIEK